MLSKYLLSYNVIVYIYIIYIRKLSTEWYLNLIVLVKRIACFVWSTLSLVLKNTGMKRKIYEHWNLSSFKSRLQIRNFKPQYKLALICRKGINKNALEELYIWYMVTSFDKKYCWSCFSFFKILKISRF